MLRMFDWGFCSGMEKAADIILPLGRSMKWLLISQLLNLFSLSKIVKVLYWGYSGNFSSFRLVRILFSINLVFSIPGMLPEARDFKRSKHHEETPIWTQLKSKAGMRSRLTHSIGERLYWRRRKITDKTNFDAIMQEDINLKQSEKKVIWAKQQATIQAQVAQIEFTHT